MEGRKKKTYKTLLQTNNPCQAELCPEDRSTLLFPLPFPNASVVLVNGDDNFELIIRVQCNAIPVRDECVSLSFGRCSGLGGMSLSMDSRPDSREMSSSGGMYGAFMLAASFMCINLLPPPQISGLIRAAAVRAPLGTPRCSKDTASRGCVAPGRPGDSALGPSMRRPEVVNRQDCKYDDFAISHLLGNFALK